MWVCAHECRCLKGPRGIKFSESGVTAGCEPLDMGSGNQSRHGSFAKLLLTTGSFLQLQ